MRDWEIKRSRDREIKRSRDQDQEIERSDERVENVSDYFVEGEEVKVKVLEVDKQGKIRLTMKGLED